MRIRHIVIVCLLSQISVSLVVGNIDLKSEFSDYTKRYQQKVSIVGEIYGLKFGSASAEVLEALLNKKYKGEKISEAVPRRNNFLQLDSLTSYYLERKENGLECRYGFKIDEKDHWFVTILFEGDTFIESVRILESFR